MTMNKGVGWLLLAIVAGVGLSCDGPVSEQPIGTAPAVSREHAIERTPADLTSCSRERKR